MTDDPLLAVLAAAIVALLLWSLTSLGARISENGDRITRLEEKVDARFAAVDERFDGMEVRFDGMEARLAGMEARLAGMEARFAEMDAEIDEISENMAAVLAILRAGDNAAAAGSDGPQSVVAASPETDRPN